MNFSKTINHKTYFFEYMAPPLPGPNREIRPVSADGTAIMGELVAAEILKTFHQNMVRGFLWEIFV